MLKINVKFVANELVPGLVNGEYSIEAGSTVRELIAVCEAHCGVSIPTRNFAFMYPLFNGKPLPLDRALTEDGTLHLSRVVMGG